MKIQTFATEAQLDRAAAEVVAERLRSHPATVLGLPTGATPVGMYAHLVAMVRGGALSFAQAVTFNLDEYIGLDPEHPCSYMRFMRENLFDHVDCPPANIHIPNGAAPDPHKACAAYDAEILAAGGIDLQILGIGSNGHIGFNEPGTPATQTTHVTDLSESTVRDNARFFDSISEVPRQAITMGLANILDTRSILLLAKGANKADALYRMLNEPITPDLPASCLRNHPDVLVMVDAQAAARLNP